MANERGIREYIMAKFYIATSLSRAKDHNFVRDHLLARGHVLTYDWTHHGSVKTTTLEMLNRVAHKEFEGVGAADFVVVLLPGGFGTHVEIGAAIAFGKKVVIHSEDKEVFMPSDKTNAFYHHQGIEKLSCPFKEIGKHLDSLELFSKIPRSDSSVTFERGARPHTYLS